MNFLVLVKSSVEKSIFQCSPHFYDEDMLCSDSFYYRPVAVVVSGGFFDIGVYGNYYHHFFKRDSHDLEKYELHLLN